jgi:hypothetical protein
MANILTRHIIHLVELTMSGKPSDRVLKCDLVHGVNLEPDNG